MKKQFIGDCVNNPFENTEVLSGIIENARDITKGTFLRNCGTNWALRRDMKVFPSDYSFSKYKGIYFFTWSMIEHFYR